MFGLRKYTLLPAQPVNVRGYTLMLHRIVAARNIPEHNVKRGDVGGLVSSKHTLSHKGSCWITLNAIVVQTEKEYSPSIIGDVIVKGNACVLNSRILHEGRMEIGGNASIQNSTLAYDFKTTSPSVVIDDARILESRINGRIWMTGNASLESSRCEARDKTIHLSGNISVLDSHLIGGIEISGNVRVTESEVSNETKISGDAVIELSKIGSDGKVVIKDNVYVRQAHLLPHTGSMIYASNNVKIIGSVGNHSIVAPFMGETITIMGNVKVNESKISGDLNACDDVEILGSDVSGNNYLTGNVKLESGAVLQGQNHLEGNTVVKRAVHVASVPAPKLMEFPDFPEFPKFPDMGELMNLTKGFGTFEIPKIPSIPAIPSMPSFGDTMHQVYTNTGRSVFEEEVLSPKKDDFSPYFNAIKETLADYDAYTTDIVKLLKYPAMADGTIPETRELMVAARKARRELKAPTSIEEVKRVSRELELAFTAAESKALTVSTSHLDEKSKQSLEKASQMLSLACDSGAADNERKLGFKAGMKSLEGIIHVSEEAIDAFKAKSGLLQIEA